MESREHACDLQRRSRGWFRPALLTVALVLLAGSGPLRANEPTVSVRFELDDPHGSPFPSDRFSVVDLAQRSGRRVRLPKPDCNRAPSDCQEIDVLNELDGFNIQPRIAIPFSGAIDPASVSSDSIYLVPLGDALSGSGGGRTIGINQIVWDPLTLTLSCEADQLLEPHTRYLLVVTDAVRDAAGRPIERAPFARFLLQRAAPSDLEGKRYAAALRLAERYARVRPRHVAALALFTTQSISDDLEKIHEQIARSQPAPLRFVQPGGTTPLVFPVAAVTSIVLQRQVSTTSPPAFLPVALPLIALQVRPGAVGRIAFGTYRSPQYTTPDGVIPTVPTLRGKPTPSGSSDITCVLFLPSSPRPANGWPVAIFGHGLGDSKFGAPLAVASVFAARGIATLAIDALGHGGGPLSALEVQVALSPAVRFSAGGRSVDQDGNGLIDPTEGSGARPPRSMLGLRDGIRQTAIDLMQLVREIGVGVDVEDDGARDLDPQRIYYAGQSLGGIYGSLLLALEPRLAAGVLNVVGGSLVEIFRQGAFRPLLGIALATRVPPLINVPDPTGIAFNENLPLRDLAPIAAAVPGAAAIQEALERAEWATQSGDAVAYAPYLRRRPLRGNGPKRVLVQFARGDRVAPNPTTTAVLRAGRLDDAATYLRADLAFAANPLFGNDPHTFLTALANPAAAPAALLAQEQIAVFFASGGTQVVDPDPGPLFETPIQGPLPETPNFFP